MTLETLTRLKSRLKKINIEIELSGNFPWIYLRSVNNNRVTERYLGNHGFTIMFLPIREFGNNPSGNLNEIELDRESVLL